MNILWLKSDLLLPLDKGGKLRTWHLLRHLARRHEITYLAFAAPDVPAASIEGMREVAAHVECIPRTDAAKRSLRFYLDAGLHLFDPLPYAIGKYRSAAFSRRVAALMRERAFDVVVCDFVLPAVNLPGQLACPLVIFTHNVESEIWRRHADTQRNALLRWLYAAQHQRMLRFEERALARADGILAVSDADADTLTRLYPGAVRGPVHVVPTGVDTAFFTPARSTADSRTLVFTGSMDWLPNEDAMLFFCAEVLPLIREAEPATSLVIVGREPTPAVRRLAHEHGITVTGRVDDVRPPVAEAAVYVVPLRIGGGTRLKIFEAMAMGKAVVSTGIGAEGLPVRDGEHLLLADEPRAFAGAVVALLRDVDRRRQIEAAARALMVERYDWSAVAGALEEALWKTARAGVTTAGESVSARDR
jgi:sugar transferase (PEP-CTERM/EpsH1 system associated)